MPPTDAEIAALYDRYGPVLLHRCRGILRNEEAAQDATLVPEAIPARIKQLYDEMIAAAEALEFEQAAAVRDRIRALEARHLGLD